MISGKITTAPRLVSEHLIKNENKHQIMNVHTKWNCLIPILSTLVKNYLFQLRQETPVSVFIKPIIILYLVVVSCILLYM